MWQSFCDQIIFRKSLKHVQYRMQRISPVVIIVLEIFDRPVHHKWHFQMRKSCFIYFADVIDQLLTSAVVFISGVWIKQCMQIFIEFDRKNNWNMNFQAETIFSWKTCKFWNFDIFWLRVRYRLYLTESIQYTQHHAQTHWVLLKWPLENIFLISKLHL